MDSLRQFWSRFVGLFRRHNLETEMAEEMRQHLEHRAQQKIAEGLSPDEARYAAHREFGGIAQVQEQCRDVRRFGWLEDLQQDVRYASRSLRRSAGWTTVAVLTLAIGIGLNAAVFAVFHAVAFRPLPVTDPTRVVKVYQRLGNEQGYRAFSYPEYAALRDHNDVFTDLIAYSWAMLELRPAPTGEAGSNSPAPLAAMLVSGNYFAGLGGKIAFGRPLLLDDDRRGADPVAVLSHLGWQGRFGGDPGIVGRSVVVNGAHVTVVGIAAPEFVGTELQVPELWLTLGGHASLAPRDNRLNDNSSFWLLTVARLRPGFSRTQAATRFDELINRLALEYLRISERVHVVLSPGSFLARPDEKAQLASVTVLAGGIVSMILLIASVNLANLLLARIASRQHELGIRLSLGAGRGRLLRQLLTENAVLAILGGAAGLILIKVLPGLLLTLLRPPQGQLVDLRLTLGWPVLVYSLLISLFTAFVFGLVPALHAIRSGRILALEKGALLGRWFRGRRLQNFFVTGQAALCVLLLADAGLLLRGLQRAQWIDAGFDTDHVLTVSVNLRANNYDQARAAEFHRRLREQLVTMPDVRSVSMSSLAPLGGVSRGAPVTAQPSNGGGLTPDLTVDYYVVSPNYFETLRLPLVKGRAFTPADSRDGHAVAIINEALARQFWPNGEPVGQQIRVGPPNVPFSEVIGVVRNARTARLWEGDKPQVYLPLIEGRTGPGIQTQQLGMVLLVATSGQRETMATAIQRITRTLDPVVFATVRSLAEARAEQAWFSRIGAMLAGAMGVLAVMLAGVGLFGVASYAVVQRTREFGIRMALGAQRRDIFGLILGQGALLVGVGTVLGLSGALVSSRALTGFLYGLDPWDPQTALGICLTMGVVILSAHYLPARRAMRVDPVEALRTE